LEALRRKRAGQYLCTLERASAIQPKTTLCRRLAEKDLNVRQRLQTENLRQIDTFLAFKITKMFGFRPTGFGGDCVAYLPFDVFGFFVFL
jgi:hypothetical protein